MITFLNYVSVFIIGALVGSIGVSLYIIKNGGDF